MDINVEAESKKLRSKSPFRSKRLKIITMITLIASGAFCSIYFFGESVRDNPLSELLLVLGAFVFVIGFLIALIYVTRMRRLIREGEVVFADLENASHLRGHSLLEITFWFEGERIDKTL
ncbi:MAG: hypothetical protein AAFN77_04850 [Planctomycetota bacterium]